MNKRANKTKSKNKNKTPSTIPCALHTTLFYCIRIAQTQSEMGFFCLYLGSKTNANINNTLPPTIPPMTATMACTNYILTQPSILPLPSIREIPPIPINTIFNDSNGKLYIL